MISRRRSSPWGWPIGRIRPRRHALEWRVNVELALHLEVPLVLHLARAGFGEFLERKLIGTPASLRALVEQQDARTPAIEAS